MLYYFISNYMEITYQLNMISFVHYGKLVMLHLLLVILFVFIYSVIPAAKHILTPGMVYPSLIAPAALKLIPRFEVRKLAGTPFQFHYFGGAKVSKTLRRL